MAEVDLDDLEVDLDAIAGEVDLDAIAGEVDLDAVAGGSSASSTVETDALLGEDKAPAESAISPEELAKASARNDLEAVLKSTVISDLECALVLSKGKGIPTSDSLYQDVSEKVTGLKNVDKELAAAMKIKPVVKHFEIPKV